MGKTSNLNRVDAIAKVTGAATYSAEYKLPGTVYACLVGSTVAKGKIKTIDVSKAAWAPGVLEVITHENLAKVVQYPAAKDNPDRVQPLHLFKDNVIRYYDQPVALVVADSFERMRYAASLIKATYEKDQHETDLHNAKDSARKPARNADYTRGVEDGYNTADVKIEHEYVLPVEVHSPMEPASIIAFWENGKPTVHTKTQGVEGTRRGISEVFGLTADDVTVHAEYVGGAFGMGLHTWPYEIAALLAAKKTKKPVKLMLHREQMFTNVGFRPYTIQKIGLGATKDGKLTGITHEALGQTSTYEDFTEATVNMSRFMYDCPNVTTRYRIAGLNNCTPIWMRGPGEATGSFALESAIDELAYKLNLDPVAFRKLNHADKDPENGKPWSSKHLLECYDEGMKRIGWNNRKPVPATNIKEGWMVGYGMGTGTFGAFRSPTSVRAKFTAAGNLVLESSVNDMGPGTATMMTAIGAETAAISPDKVVIHMGSSGLPKGPTQGGSATTSTVGTGVHDACVALNGKIKELAAKHKTFKGTAVNEIVFEEGSVYTKAKPANKLKIEALLAGAGLSEIVAEVTTTLPEEAKQYSSYSFSVHFVKISVNPVIGKIRIDHVVSCADIGTVVNEKTAASQMYGGAVGGIGMALMESLETDHRFGRPINNNFADYHVPVNADILKQEVYFVNKPDPYTNPMGSKGLGETSLVGMAPAIANAVFNATGKRIRELPITPDKLLF